MRFSGLGYFIAEGFNNVFKNKKSTMTSLLTMVCAMFLFGATYAIGENINYIMEQVQQSQGIEVFIVNEATEEEENELEAKITALEGVSSVTYKSKEEALESMKESFQDYPDVIAGYEDEYIFPASFVIMLTDLNYASEVEEAISEMDNVKSVRSSNDTIDTLLKIANGIKVAIAVVFVGLLIIAITIISNTIKLSVHSRRKEISIMKYIGATNGFIRGPFVVEGIVIGIIAACISIMLITFVYDVVITNIGSSEVLVVMNITLLDYASILKSIVIVFMSLGIGLGVIGSAFSMKKYLEV